MNISTVNIRIGLICKYKSLLEKKGKEHKQEVHTKDKLVVNEHTLKDRQNKLDFSHKLTSSELQKGKG